MHVSASFFLRRGTPGSGFAARAVVHRIFAIKVHISGEKACTKCSSPNPPTPNPEPSNGLDPGRNHVGRFPDIRRRHAAEFARGRPMQHADEPCGVSPPLKRGI